MKVTIDFVDVDRLVSSSQGSHAVVAVNGEADQYRTGVVRISQWSRWYLVEPTGEILPLGPKDKVALFSMMKVS